MKTKVLLAIIVLLFSISPNCIAISTQQPKPSYMQFETNNPQDNFLNLLKSFCIGIYKKVSGDSPNTPLVKSDNIELFSNTIKSYQTEEEKLNKEYKYSHTKDKTDFGTGILDLLAFILKIFNI